LKSEARYVPRVPRYGISCTVNRKSETVYRRSETEAGTGARTGAETGTETGAGTGTETGAGTGAETGAETVDNFVCIVFKGLILLTKVFISYNKGNVFLL
jgi:hypothetical protein